MWDGSGNGGNGVWGRVGTAREHPTTSGEECEDIAGLTQASQQMVGDGVADLEECDGGTVAHTEQEEADEDGDGCPEPVQLPVLGLSTGIVHFHPWTEREVSVCLSQHGVTRAIPCVRRGCVEFQEKVTA